MLLTEDEARTKECRVAPLTPAVAGLAGGQGGYNLTNPTVMKCAASGCMQWRWGIPLKEDVPAGPLPLPPEGEGWRRVSVEGGFVWRRVKAQRGYCGLAGVSTTKEGFQPRPSPSQPSP